MYLQTVALHKKSQLQLHPVEVLRYQSASDSEKVSLVSLRIKHSVIFLLSLLLSPHQNNYRCPCGRHICVITFPCWAPGCSSILRENRDLLSLLLILCS